MLWDAAVRYISVSYLNENYNPYGGAHLSPNYVYKTENKSAMRGLYNYSNN